MKKLLFIICLVLGSFSAKAQFQKGLKEVGGNFGFSSSEQIEWNSYTADNNTVNQINFNFNPKIGWFVSESSVLGIGLGYNYYKRTFGENDQDENRHIYSIRPYFSNYQKIIDKLFYTTTVNLSYSFWQPKIVELCRS